MPNREIQRRIFQAVEQNSLKCLNVLCDIYEKHEEFKTPSNECNQFYRCVYLVSGFLNKSKHPKETALHVLASKPESTEAMTVLEKQPKFLSDFSDFPDSHGATPLLVAIKCNNIEFVKRLLVTKPKIQPAGFGIFESPILFAALNDHTDVIGEILKTCEFLGVLF